jgi:hypothetical protein
LKISNFKVIPLKTFIFNYYLWLFFFLVFSLINPVESAATCNNFPKIFGGNLGHANLYQIDVYNDYLAMAGRTTDSTLTEISEYIPYLAVSSISTGGKYYWAKALSLKEG